MRKKEEMSEQDKGEKTGGWGEQKARIKEKKSNQMGKKKSD